MHFKKRLSRLLPRMVYPAHFFVLAGIMVLSGVNAQEIRLPVNEQGRIEYLFHNQVLPDSLITYYPIDPIIKEISSIRHITGCLLSADTIQSVECKVQIMLYKKVSFTLQPDALVYSTLHILFEHNYAVIRIDEFLFQDYARDRYGKFTPSSSRITPLEKVYLSFSGSLWQSHLSTINNETLTLGENLAKTIKNQLPQPKNDMVGRIGN